MARLTDAQVRRAREQALRAIRRSQRKVDTRVETMERRLDRAIENRERITFPLLGSVIADFRAIIILIRELEAMLADAAIIFTETGS